MRSRPSSTASWAATLSERVRRAIAANADIVISIHANFAGHERGYLRVSGTSTYYKWSFSRDLADAIHARLLDATQLPDFGNVAMRWPGRSPGTACP